MELQPKQQQEKETKSSEKSSEGERSVTKGGKDGGGGSSDVLGEEVTAGKDNNQTGKVGSDKSKSTELKEKKRKDDGGSVVDSDRTSIVGDPGPSPRTKDSVESSRKEKESFPSLFISHASINISGSNPDISESEKFKVSSTRLGGSIRRESTSTTGDGESSLSKADLDNINIPQRIAVHRVCSDSRIGEGEGFHSSKLTFFAADGSLTNSLKALGLSINSNNSGSRSGSIKTRGSKRQGSSNNNEEKQLFSELASNGNNNVGGASSASVSSSVSNVNKSRSQALNRGSETGRTAGGESKESCVVGKRNNNGNGGGAKHTIDILPVIEQSISEGKTEHPSTSEGEETLTEDVVDDDEELLDEYDEQNENLDCQLDFDAAVTELLLRPENDDASRYKDSATWTQEDDMPSPISDLSPVASPRRKKERSSNLHRELERELSGGGPAASHSHNSLLEQYHQYLLEQQQQQQPQQPQIHRHSRGGSGSKSGGSGSHHHSHHSHGHHNTKSSIVGIHQGNLKSQSHSHTHHHHHRHSPLPPPPPPHQAECFTVSSQLLSREAKLYENVPATQGELETLEILLASGGSGDSNYPPSGGSGSGGGASNTTASTSNTSGTSGQSHGQSHKSTSSHGNNLNNNHSGNNNTGHHHHHRSHHHQQQQSQLHHQNHHNHHLLHQGYVHGQHSHSATNLNSNSGNSAEQLFSVSDFLGPGGGLQVGNNNGGPPSRTSWADSGRESLSFDGENNNSTGSTRNLLLIPPPPPPPINYLASSGGAAAGVGTGTHSGFVGNTSSSMMHSSHHKHHSSHHHHHHSHHPSHSHGQSSDSPSHHNTKRSRRERLVRQKHAINDETVFPSSQNGREGDNTGIILGDTGMNSGFMAAPSPRRGILPGSLQASNFVAAAASPINLQRHPPASQIMLQENKKNGALIACESPYGIMAGGVGTGGAGDWSYPETFGENFSRRGTSKSHLTSNLLRSRSPQRGRSGGGNGNKGNSSFDYGELPSHQMFPKRHLLQSRQFSGHHRGYSPSGVGGTMQNGSSGGGGPGVCPPTGYQPMQHRSFPAGVFSGATPRSCSMGDLTSSAASLNGPSGQGHHHSNHHGGKSPDRMAISSNTAPVSGMQSSTVPLVTSLPLPPATSVTYEFSLAPVSGTLAPGWHLTAVQRGLATAVPLAAAVARRRLPRPRTARPRFGFTDKNEARRAKWTIVITALALLAMSMLLVGVTLRLAPLIDDLGSSSSGSFKNRITFRRDPLSRRASGDAVTASTSHSSASFKTKRGILNHRHYHRSFHNYDCSSSNEQCLENNGQNNLGQNEYSSCHSSRQNLSFSLAPLEEKADGKYGALLTTGEETGKGREDGCIDDNDYSEEGEVPLKMRRQISMTLSIPSREDSVRSQSSTKSYGSYSASPKISGLSAALPITSTAPLFSCGSKLAAGQMRPSSMGKLVRYGSNPDVFPSRHLKKKQQSEENCGYQLNRMKALSSSRSPGGSSCNLRSQKGSCTSLADKKKQILSQKKRNEKVAWAVHLGFSSLLILAITCIIVFLRLSSTMTTSSSSSEYYTNSSPEFSSRNDSAVPRNGTSYSFNMTDDGTDNVRKENENLLQSIQPQLNLNATTPQPTTHTQQVQDNSIAKDDKGNKDKDVDKSIANLQSGQSLARRTISSSSSSDNTQGEDEGDTESHKSNNETTNENVGVRNLAKGIDTKIEEGSSGGSPNRSNKNNNDDDDSNISIVNGDNSGSSITDTNPSLKSTSIRPKRSKRTKLEEDSEQQQQQHPRNSNIIINVLTEKKHSEASNKETPPGLTKTRHLESTLIRFLKNSGGQGRERRYLENDTRKL